MLQSCIYIHIYISEQGLRIPLIVHEDASVHLVVVVMLLLVAYHCKDRDSKK